MVHGYSIGAPSSGESTPTTAETVAAQAVTIKAIIDRLMWLRRRLAALSDQAVEPEDMRIDDKLKNTEREA